MAQNPFDQQAPIEGIKNIILVGSGKGGVGKSTVTANLAMALKKQGKKVGLLDADIYGPSVPRLFGVLNQPPPVDENNKIHPVSRYGIKLMSLGLMIEEGSAVVWRGPMLFKAMDQFFRDVAWGELDYLLVDLPPGTGDIPLTIAQKVPVTGAIIVCTPQNLALADAKKAFDMFKQVQVPVYGVVENMSGYTTPSGETVDLFPRGELSQFLDANKYKNLAKVPFDPLVGLTCEAGVPLVESQPESDTAQAYMRLAAEII